MFPRRGGRLRNQGPSAPRLEQAPRLRAAARRASKLDHHFSGTPQTQGFEFGSTGTLTFGGQPVQEKTPAPFTIKAGRTHPLLLALRLETQEQKQAVCEDLGDLPDYQPTPAPLTAAFNISGGAHGNSDIDIDIDHAFLAKSLSAPHSTAPPRDQVLDTPFILANLARLNRSFQPYLRESQLREVGEKIWNELRQKNLLGRAVREVWEQAAGVWIGRLVESKGAAREERERVDRNRTEEKEQKQDWGDWARVGESLVFDGSAGARGRKDSGIEQLLPGFLDVTSVRCGDANREMDAPVLGQFLVQVNGFVQARNAESLADWLVLEPPFGAQYHQMIVELQRVYPRGSDEALEKKCGQVLKAAQEGDQGSSWTQFIRFMAQYLAYLRDVSPDQSRYLDTYHLLSELQGKGNSALGHPSLGHLVLQTVVTNARLVCRLAIGLDRKPELLGASRQHSTTGGRESLPEQAANTIRTAFTTALNDRSGTPSGLDPATGRPTGKKKGIYILTNLCLRILFQCRKTRNATQIFNQIAANAPPLDVYPKAQQVTYLYYLGRFLFQNSHFLRAAKALQAAYGQSPTAPQCQKQRRLILIYLLASNTILGRFPSDALLSRPEAVDLAPHFLPIFSAIKSGNLPLLRRHLSLDNPSASFFLHYRILLHLQNRTETLALRSLVRKTFILAGVLPDPNNPKAAASLNLPDLMTALALVERLSPHSAPGEDVDPDLDGAELDPTADAVASAPDELGVECVLASLIEQGLLSGYLARRQKKLAILGAKNFGGNAVKAGFPGVADVVGKRSGAAGVVPGWLRGSGAASTFR